MKFPGFDSHARWFNSPPLTDADLQGKLVVLDFWTFCCINCIHTLATLKKLEEKFRNHPILFIGVHSPKFAHERDDEAIDYAILRYGVRHPVVNDASMTLWKELQIHSWPTMMLIAPDGEILGSVSGEPNLDDLERALMRAIEHYRLKPLPQSENHTIKSNHKGRLFFPSKLLATDRNLYIADSSHHQIVVAEEKKVTQRIGSGEEGFRDGSFEKAQFNRPQGMVLYKEKLLVADTGNHAIRLVDFTTKRVETLIGIGEQGRDYRGGKEGEVQPVASPWDLAIWDGKLMIAMAGTHQIWAYDFATKKAHAFNGSGRELHFDSDAPTDSSWAQPSGLSLHGDELYIADSESSSIRRLDLKRNMSETLAGGDLENPYNLFCYGDRDGRDALFQHPLALLYVPMRDKLLIADTYNHKLKWLDVANKEVATWNINYPLSEPSGLAVLGKDLFVANTNRHEIVHIDLVSEKCEVWLA